MSAAHAWADHIDRCPDCQESLRTVARTHAENMASLERQHLTVMASLRRREKQTPS